MIELVLVFLLGFVTALTLWLMLLPAFWRRTERITRAALERAMPISLNEISAERDLLRAEKSIAIARADLRVEAAQKALLLGQSEIGEGLKRAAELGQSLKDRDLRIEALVAEIEARRAEITEFRVQVSSLESERDAGIATIKALELHRDGLSVRLASTIDLSENRRIAQETTSLELERVRAGLAEQEARNANLRTEMQDKDIALREAERTLSTMETQRLRLVAEAGDALAKSMTMPTLPDAPVGNAKPTLPAAETTPRALPRAG